MKVCSFEGCGREHKARGLCAPHTLQYYKGKPLTPIQQWKGSRGNPATGPGTCCTIDGCKKTVYSGGLCSMHRWRVNTHGDSSVCTTNRYFSMEDRFWMKVRKGPNCWTWTGGARDGYGTFRERHQGRTHLAHRLAYEFLIGAIPEGKLLDHRCRNTLCVNPSHLRPVTHKQNMEHKDGPHRNNKSSGVRNVSRRRNGRYYVIVTHNGQVYRGGSFDALEEAAESARQLRLRLFTHNDLDRRAS